MRRKQFESCKDVQVNVGDDFDWINSGKTDCTITHCDPPLELKRYDVPANGTTPAKVSSEAKRGTYEYKCKCKKMGSKTNPHIIVS